MTSIKAGLNAIICLPKDMAINMLRLNQIEPTSSPENSAYNWAKFQKISSVWTPINLILKTAFTYKLKLSYGGQSRKNKNANHVSREKKNSPNITPLLG